MGTKRHGNGETDRQTERGKWLASFRAVASPGFGWGQNDMEMERQTERGKWLAPFRAVASPGFGARTEEGHKTTRKYSSHAHKIHRAKKRLFFTLSLILITAVRKILKMFDERLPSRMLCIAPN